MSAPDYYGTLGVAPDATTAEIRRAYKRLARRYHPDVNAGDAKAEEKFKAVSEAHAVLTDPARREAYDRSRRGGWSAAEGPGGFGFTGDLDGLGDLFARIFGGPGGFGGGRGRAAARSRQASVSPELVARVGFLEALRGLTLPVRLRGASGEETVQVRVPAGVRDGDRLRVPTSRTGQPGDLRVRIQVASHPVFRREGADVALTLPVTVSEAALGAQVEVPTPEGSARLTVPAGTASGQRLRLRGRGAPRREGGRGDLLVEIQVLTPTADDPESRRLLEELQRRQPAVARDDLLRRARS